MISTKSRPESPDFLVDTDDVLLPSTPTKRRQPNLFYGSLMDMLDNDDPLIALADTIEWEAFDERFASYYSDEGRPAKPIRLMVGLLLLKQLEDLSDENVVLQFKRNPYYQYFCGFDEYVPAVPCDPSDLVYFRRRIGKKGVEQVFKTSVQLHGKAAEEKQVIIDTTVQEKAITYPTDGKLAIRMVHHLHRTAKKEGIQLRRTYVREIKVHRISLRFFRHPKKVKKAKAAIKRLRTIVGILIRDISRKLPEERLATYQETFDLFEKVRKQKVKDTNKVYSLHESHVYAITKGKDQELPLEGTRSMSMGRKPPSSRPRRVGSSSVWLLMRRTSMTQRHWKRH